MQRNVGVEVRIDYVEFSYVSGGLRFRIDGDPLPRHSDADGYLEYLLDTTVSNVLQALETAIRTGDRTTARAAGGSGCVVFEPIDTDRVRLSVLPSSSQCEPRSVRLESGQGDVVETGDVCREVCSCARKVAWACEADAASLDWPAELEAFDRSGEDHFLRERIRSVRTALENAS